MLFRDFWHVKIKWWWGAEEPEKGAGIAYLQELFDFLKEHTNVIFKKLNQKQKHFKDFTTIAVVLIKIKKQI